MEENNMDELEALVAQVPDEVLDYIEALEERVEKAEAAVAAPAVEDAEDEIAKALSELPPGAAELFKSQRDRLAQAEQALEAERVAKADSEWINRARSFDGIVDDPEAFGRDLRQVAEANADLANRMATALSAASAQVTKSALFSESGHNVPAAGSPAEKVQNIAKAMIEADPLKTREEAEAEAWLANPDLYDQHVAEKQASLRGGN